MNDFLPPCVGSKIKLVVTGQKLPNGLHMSDVDFICAFRASKKEQIVKKEDMRMIDEDNYLAVVDTSIVGTGEIYLKITFNLPDADVKNTGIRPEIVTLPTGVRVCC